MGMSQLAIRKKVQKQTFNSLFNELSTFWQSTKPLANGLLENQPFWRLAKIIKAQESSSFIIHISNFYYRFFISKSD